MKSFVIRILLLVPFTCTFSTIGNTHVAAEKLKNKRQGPIGRQEGRVEDLPNALRAMISKALLARNRELLGSSLADEPPAVAPIIGGTDASEHKYPWHAVVFYFYYDIPYYYGPCGGTIYNERTVVTAGHCVEDTEQVDGYFVIVTGAYDLSIQGDLEQVVLVDAVRLHKGFRYSGAYVVRNDIALLITDEALNFNTIAVRPVPKLSTRRGDRLAIRSDNCVAIGYGIFLEQEDDRVLPDILQEYSPVNFVPNKACHQVMWKDAFSLTSKMVCSIEPNAGTCNGDSGGSTGCYDKKGVYYQVGITSWSFKPEGRCGDAPNVYTRVSKYRRWIQYYSYKV